MATALVCCYGGGHARALLPVIRNLRDRGHVVNVLGLTTAHSFFLSAGIEVFSLSDVLTKATDWEEVKSYADKVLGYFDSHHLSNRKRDTIAYMGSGFRDLCRIHGTTTAIELFDKKGRKAFDQRNTALEVLKHFVPDVLISSNAPRFERAIVFQARIAKINSLVVVDGPALKEMDWLSDSCFGDHLAVFHGSVKNKLVELGRLDTSVTVTGNPAFDALREIALRRRGLPRNERPHVVYLSQQEAMLDLGLYELESEKRIVKSIIEALYRGQHQGLLTAEVRFHPHQTNQVRRLNYHLLDRSLTSTIEETLEGADVVVTASSTAGLQAQFLGIPVVEVGWSILAGSVNFEVFGGSLKATRPEHLVEKALVAAHRKGTPNDDLGSATNKVAEIVERML